SMLTTPKLVAVALNVAVAPPGAVATSVFAPADGPSVHDPTVAMPDPFVTGVAAVTVPPPTVTANVIVAPDTALPNASCARTDGASTTAAPGAADWSVSVSRTSSLIAPGVDSTVNTVLSAPALAVSVCWPGVFPIVQLYGAARPFA